MLGAGLYPLATSDAATFAQATRGGGAAIIDIVMGAVDESEPQVSTTSPPPSAPAASPKSTSVPSTYRLDWASLLKRVFGGARRVPYRSMS